MTTGADDFSALQRRHFFHAGGHNEPVDGDLLTVFLAEGQELLAQIGTSLQLLRKAPGDSEPLQSLLRALHTLKGSARLVEAEQLGAHMHAMESRLSALTDGVELSSTLLNALQMECDVGQQLFEAWHGLQTMDAADSHARRGAVTAVVRMHADAHDKLLGQVNAISIAHCRMAALMQMLPQLTHSAPIDELNQQLFIQRRLTRDMHRSLLLSRMGRFSEVEERLQRLVRQLAGETGKALKLEVLGGALKLDRSILEKMQGTMEHLLRNAAAHGIESMAQRQVSGKNPVGMMRLEAVQQGNALMIRLSDDGRGLPWQKIREQAVLKGLLTSGKNITDSELAELIFQLGFSTRTEISPLARRGIGLHAVRAEVSALAGHISVKSVAGQGTVFTIDLPLSQILMPVVLVQVGAQTYAIPARQVVQVLRLRPDERRQILRNATLPWRASQLPVHRLHALLGCEQAIREREVAAVLIIGNKGPCMGLLVERLIGTHAVTIKHSDVQLPGIIGMLGATVLADGTSALNLNPLALVQRQADRSRLSLS